MKYQTQFLVLCSLGTLSSAHAQSRPFRVQVSRDGLMGILSLDVKKNPKRSQVFSLYAESWLGEGFLCAGDIFPVEASPSTRFESFTGIGVSMRQPLRRDVWMGLGLGGYTRHYRDCINLDRNVTGVGGKAFVGYGRGVLFGEAAFIAPANFKDSRLELTVGVRL